jgi:hypothetical protein
LPTLLDIVAHRRCERSLLSSGHSAVSKESRTAQGKAVPLREHCHRKAAHTWLMQKGAAGTTVGECCRCHTGGPGLVDVAV